MKSDPDRGDAADEVLYGKETENAVANFEISGRPVPATLIAAYAHVKAAAARANARFPETGIDDETADAVVAAADEVISGRWADQFPVDVFQTGSGTSTNMNVNEVLATLAGRRLGRVVHPNEVVNASQSTNDTMPTAIRTAALHGTVNELLPDMRRLERELGAKAVQMGSIVKAGRTHLMDATPVMLGHELDGHRAQVRGAAERLSGCLGRLGAVPLGGTATGNGFGAPVGYAAAAVAELKERTGLELSESPSRFASQGAQDDLVELSAHLRGAAVTLLKIANDLRFMASGPATGLGEIEMPELQAGSSMMPGKNNPVICEAVMQVCAQVMGNDAAVAVAAGHGNLELNTFLPMIARNLLESIGLLAAACGHLADKCVVTIEVDIERSRQHAEASLALATALVPVVGYDQAAEIARRARRSRRTLLEVAVEAGVDADEARRLLDVDAMARGSISVERPELPYEDPHVPAEDVTPQDSGIVGPSGPGDPADD